MASKQVAGGPTSRRYSEEEKAAAVRMVRTLRAEVSKAQGPATWVADQLGYGADSVRTWVKRADSDGGKGRGVSSEVSARMKALEQETRELRQANEVPKQAASFFGAEIDRKH